jgi:hypothetical protein
LAIVSVLTFASLLRVQDLGPDARALLERLRSRNWKERAAAFESLRTERQTATRVLLEVLRGPRREPHEAFATTNAMLMLGEFRALAAVEPLVANITYYDPSLPVSEPYPLRCYPAADALVAIGEPSIRGMFGRLRDPVNNDELRIMAFVIYMIDDSRDLGLARIKVAIESGDYGEEIRANLARLYDLYKITDFDDERQWPRPKPASTGTDKKGG